MDLLAHLNRSHAQLKRSELFADEAKALNMVINALRHKRASLTGERSEPDLPRPRVIATFVPQTRQGTALLDAPAADCVQIDVTERVASMNRDDAADIDDGSPEARLLWTQHPMSTLIDPEGPYTVRVRESIAQYLRSQP